MTHPAPKIETETHTLLNGGLTLIQPKDGYRVSIDSVFLAATVLPKDGAKVLDMGCGVGSLGLCIKAFAKDIDFELRGIDIQADYIELARQNAEVNDIDAEYNVCDVTGQIPEGLDHVVMNPPYYEDGANIPSPNAPVATSHNGRLNDWIVAAAKALKPGGRLHLILPAERIEELQKLLRTHQCGAIKLMPIYPKSGRSATRIIVEARKHKTKQMDILPALIVHTNNGDYSDKAARILNGTQRMKGFQP